MATVDADIALEGFLDLERRFESFVRVVPVAPEHNSVYSPALTSILLDTCSMVETVLKSSMDNARYNTINNITAIRAKRYTQNWPYLNINDLRAVFKADTFYAKPVWYLPRNQRSFPWYAWRKTHGHPKWWDAYNSVKHSRFQQVKKASLLTTLHALKGLFLALVQSPEFRLGLINRGVIRCNGTGLGIQHLQQHVVLWEPIQVAWLAPVTARSELFGYKFLTSGSPLHATDPTIFL
jgi:hypothetical protein